MTVGENEYVVDEFNGKLLTAWLEAGRWTKREAKLLFLDIDPDREHGECFSTFSGHGAVQYEYLGDDDASSSRMPHGANEEGELDYLSAEQRALIQKNLELYRKLERILNLYDSEPPHEWIELALEKGITIPWLDWAIKNKLYVQKEELEMSPSLRPEVIGLPSPTQIDTDPTTSAAETPSEHEPRKSATGHPCQYDVRHLPPVQLQSKR